MSCWVRTPTRLGAPAQPLRCRRQERAAGFSWTTVAFVSGTEEVICRSAPTRQPAKRSAIIMASSTGRHCLAAAWWPSDDARRRASSSSAVTLHPPRYAARLRSNDVMAIVASTSVRMRIEVSFHRIILTHGNGPVGRQHPYRMMRTAPNCRRCGCLAAAQFAQEAAWDMLEKPSTECPMLRGCWRQGGGVRDLHKVEVMLIDPASATRPNQGKVLLPGKTRRAWPRRPDLQGGFWRTGVSGAFPVPRQILSDQTLPGAIAYDYPIAAWRRAAFR